MTGEGIRENITPNGLRVVTERIPGFHSVALGFFFRQGSRDEGADERGASHLIEHMLFKGTKRKTAKQILAEIERLGGISDAFTAKEITGITLRCLKDSLVPLLKLLFDMLGNSAFDARELRKEKQVIYEEMRSIKEDPQDIAFDRFFAACFDSHPLGYPVVGESHTLARLDRDTLLDFYRTHYTFSDSVLVAVGDVDDDRIADLIPGRAGIRKGKRKRRKAPPEGIKPQSMVVTRSDISQVHAVMGCRTFGINSEDRFALALLATLLGGGMSSRLFSLLREDKGLVYTVSSFLELFEDSGITGFYFITEKTKLGKVFAAVEQELKRLKRTGLLKGELDTAKTLTKSSLLLNMESLSHRMARSGHWKLLAEKFRTIPQTIKRFEKVTQDEVLGLAARIFDSKPFHTSFVGPVSEKDIKPITRR